MKALIFYIILLVFSSLGAAFGKSYFGNVKGAVEDQQEKEFTRRAKCEEAEETLNNVFDHVIHPEKCQSQAKPSPRCRKAFEDFRKAEEDYESENCRQFESGVSKRSRFSSLRPPR